MAKKITILVIILTFLLGIILTANVFRGGERDRYRHLDWDYSYRTDKDCLYYWYPTSPNSSSGKILFCF